MLTRLKVKGFKSLEDVEIRFGPLTCVAGINSAGKSNLFDAIEFLQRLAGAPIMEAARSIRNNGLASLFTQTMSGQAHVMEFEADLLLDGSPVTDDSGRVATPASTYLRYRLVLQYVAGSPEEITLLSESLTGLPTVGLAKLLGFAASKEFLASVRRGGKADFISMDEAVPGQISMWQEDGNKLPRRFPVARSTVLAQLNLADYPTALAAKREMQSWKALRLELSALRRPDDFSSPSKISSQGEHLPATLARLNNSESIVARLAMLVPDVDEVLVRDIDANASRVLYLRSRNGAMQEAKTLSDGVLRFLALAVLEADPESGALICVEEPENGMHPGGVTAILELLKHTAVDPAFAVGPDNPLRQILVNTHAPQLVQRLLPDELIICHGYRRDGAVLSLYSPLPDTWRDDKSGRGAVKALGLGAVFAYLNGNSHTPPDLTEKLNIEQEYRRQLAALATK
ncbi:AAA family ATPase [Rugamonas sp. FT107W]|uniref:AAA family ATPase n=1 Tax=Duganella vulcania TaxID=2692166 RepID=A0A845HRL9_9BURK|nr:AAA family ATPase [Duganella vulcania]MYN20155.1 AAA family ATPase [Duganella vulcania]